MKLREKLLRMSAFDVITDMNDSMRNPAAGVNVCIYNCFNNHTADQRKDRCAEFGGVCNNCIAALMNEEVR